MKCFRLIRGDTLSPTYDLRKCNPLLAAGISAGASILGAKLNNDAIERNNQRQEGLINKQNSYNNPTEQVARMRQAGLNPYMMLGQISPGNQQSIAATQAGNFDTAANGVGNAVTQALTAKLNNSTISLNKALEQKALGESGNASADTALKRVDLISRAAKNEAEINSLVKQGKLSEQQAEQLRLQNDLTQLTWDEQIKKPGLENGALLSSNSKLNEETVALKLQNAITKENGKKISDAQLRLLSAQVVDMLESAKLKSSQSGYYNITNPLQGALIGSQIEANKTSSPIGAVVGSVRDSKAFKALVSIFDGDFGKSVDFLKSLVGLGDKSNPKK